MTLMDYALALAPRMGPVDFCRSRLARDGSNNVVWLSPRIGARRGLELQTAKLVAEDGASVTVSARGYVVDATDSEGGFGDDACPSSYHRSCLTWFGPGERYPDEATALNACAEAEARR